jgi:hypothetical protein
LFVFFASDEQSKGKKQHLNPASIAPFKALFDAIKALHITEPDLSDPFQTHTLPFPFLGDELPTDRFELFRGDLFRFQGRERFPDLLRAITHIPSNREPNILIYGTIGYGKSHLIAALVVYLIHQRARGDVAVPRVVFLPHCGKLDSDYLRSALALAFADDDASCAQLLAMEQPEELAEFCKQCPDRFICIADQSNALEPNTSDLVENQSRKQKMEMLLKVIKASRPIKHVLVKAASANNSMAQQAYGKPQNNIALLKFFSQVFLLSFCSSLSHLIIVC